MVFLLVFVCCLGWSLLSYSISYLLALSISVVLVSYSEAQKFAYSSGGVLWRCWPPSVVLVEVSESDEKVLPPSSGCLVKKCLAWSLRESSCFFLRERER